MKKTTLFNLFILIVFSCSSKEEVVQPTLNNPINDFTWKAMNSWYNWQDKVPALADTKDDNKNDYYKYLNNYNKPEDLFESFLYQKGTVDRFSWFIDDYEKQEEQFQGINKSFGFTPYNRPIQVDNDGIILLVLRVSKNSPASRAGLNRGDIIMGLNGEKFTSANFNTVIKGYYEDSAEFIIAEKDGTTQKSKISITKEKVADDAIQLTKVFDDVNGKKVGYLVYNGFRSSYDQSLNNTFAELKNAGINELVLDLRYNGGGSVLSCGYLASMIYGEGKAEQDVFAKTIYNKKHPNNGFTLPFLNGIFQYDSNGDYLEGQDIPLNRLTGITKLYVLTTEWTASASEMIINGLKPYIDVVVIGQTTSGKNVGSITLYDSPNSDFRDKKTANTSHKFAMQPIVFQIYNKSNESDYTSGFTPDLTLENEFKNWSEILPFGDENETFLKAALNKIKGVSGRPLSLANPNSVELKGKTIEIGLKTDMYFESNYMNNLK